jgi:hypothetical protein
LTRHTFQISETLLTMATELAKEQGLSSDDLIQCAIAREVGRRLDGPRPEDRRMARTRAAMVA